MKTTSLIIALAVVTATATSALASDKATNAKPSTVPVKKAKASASAVQQEKNVELTGSYIKRDVRRVGVITDGPSPVYVLDQTMIERSGAADLSQALIRTGFRR